MKTLIVGILLMISTMVCADIKLHQTMSYRTADSAYGYIAYGVAIESDQMIDIQAVNIVIEKAVLYAGQQTRSNWTHAQQLDVFKYHFNVCLKHNMPEGVILRLAVISKFNPPKEVIVLSPVQRDGEVSDEDEANTYTSVH